MHGYQCEFKREVSYGKAKELLDTFFFDRYLRLLSKSSRMVSLPFLVFNGSRHVRHAACMQETLLRVCGIPKLAFLSLTDIHTYILTQNEMRSRIGCLALRRLSNACIRTLLPVVYFNYSIQMMGIHGVATVYTRMSLE